MGANRNFHRKQALETEVKEIYANVAIGAAGAPTLNASKSLGITSISRSSAGLYVITLNDSWPDLRYGHVEIVTPTAEDIVANLVSFSVTSAKTVTFRCTTAGVATDPASGDSLQVKLEMKNSTAK